MSVLDTAIQEKPKHFNDPWMAGSVPGHDRRERFDFFTCSKAGIARIGEHYRARWRIEMAFRRLKSIVGLAGPPGQDPEAAKTHVRAVGRLWIMAHLLMVLLLEPHTSAPGISPRMAA